MQKDVADKVRRGGIIVGDKSEEKGLVGDRMEGFGHGIGDQWIH